MAHRMRPSTCWQARRTRSGCDEAPNRRSEGRLLFRVHRRLFDISAQIACGPTKDR